MPNEKRKFIKGFALKIIFLAALCCAFAGGSKAQQSASVYLYDDNGRLIAVIQPNGNALTYEYDAAGNFTGISNAPAGQLRIIAFLPRRGAVGTRVTIYGTGFGAGVTGVAFNGANAQIMQATATTIVTEVPLNATTGAITVTTNAGTVTSTNPFVVRGVLLSPRSLTVSANDVVPFNANVSGLPTTNVIWSVNNIVGGSAAVGTISPDGVYTAPNLVNSAPVQYTVRATSSDDSTLFDEAVVTVISAGEGFQFRTEGVSIRRGMPSNEIPTYSQNGVSVRYGMGNKSTPINSNNSVFVRSSPFLTSLSPGTVSRGSNTTLNISGVLLDNISSIAFFRASNGMSEPGITVSNITVNGQGTALTANISVNPDVAVGQFVMVVVTPSGATVRSRNNTNVIQIQ